jgi:dTDP-4-amino-4,6-dideoxygalactose transaminase
MGPELDSFENEFANYCDTKYCIGVGNGLDALRLLLIAHGIRPGDEVIVPSNTFIATWLAVTECGATPVPVEPDLHTFNIDPTLIKSVITKKTKAIIPVHLYGQPADMDKINAIAREYSLIVIEDAAQSQGALYKGRKAGCLGNAAATSFYPGKNLGALGDGGAILTNDSFIAEEVRKLRNYGSSKKYHHDLIGFNTRLDELQAAFLREKLKVLDAWNMGRKKVAQQYLNHLSPEKVIPPTIPEYSDPVWHLFVVLSDHRDELQKYLLSLGVNTGIHYPVPPHLQPCYQNIANGDFKIAERLSKEVLSLPISPLLQAETVKDIADAINNFRPS